MATYDGYKWAEHLEKLIVNVEKQTNDSDVAQLRELIKFTRTVRTAAELVEIVAIARIQKLVDSGPFDLGENKEKHIMFLRGQQILVDQYPTLGFSARDGAFINWDNKTHEELLSCGDITKATVLIPVEEGATQVLLRIPEPGSMGIVE